MGGQLVLERGEEPVERVGGVGYVQVRILLIREEIRKICFDRTIRAACFAVGVVPLRFATSEGMLGLLFDELPILRMPRGERHSEGRLIRLGEREDKCPKLFAGFGLRSSGEVFGNLLDLVELAHLHRNTLENVEESTSAVHHDRFDRPSFLFEDLLAVLVVDHTFSGHLVPPDVLLQFDGAEHADAVAAAPEGGIDEEDRCLRDELRDRAGDRIELLAYPDVRPLVFLCELSKSLFAGDVFFPERFVN